MQTITSSSICPQSYQRQGRGFLVRPSRYFIAFVCYCNYLRPFAQTPVTRGPQPGFFAAGPTLEAPNPATDSPVISRPGSGMRLANMLNEGSADQNTSSAGQTDWFGNDQAEQDDNATDDDESVPVASNSSYSRYPPREELRYSGGHYAQQSQMPSMGYLPQRLPYSAPYPDRWSQSQQPPQFYPPSMQHPQSYRSEYPPSQHQYRSYSQLPPPPPELRQEYPNYRVHYPNFNSPLMPPPR